MSVLKDVPILRAGTTRRGFEVTEPFIASLVSTPNAGAGSIPVVVRVDGEDVVIGFISRLFADGDVLKADLNIRARAEVSVKPRRLLRVALLPNKE